MTTVLTARDWHTRAAALKYSTGHFIEGEHVAARKGGRFDVVNPATGAVFCSVAAGTVEDIDAAVASCRASFREGSWRRMAPRDRLAVLSKFAQLIGEHADRFALLDTLCMGKPIRDMLTMDIPASMQTFTYFAELSDKIDGAVTATASDAFHFINMKRVSLECGGKSPQIFLGDLEDMDRAVTYAINGIFGNMGEVCNAGSRLLLDKPIAEEFIERFIDKGRSAYMPGDPLDPETNLGPLVTAQHAARVLGYIERGRKDGARLEFGGDAPVRSGSFVNPTLFSGVTNRMTIAQEEIFGPVAAAIVVDGLDEAIAVANDSIYGLAASVWTRDLNKAHKAVRSLEAGVIWVNCFDHGDMTQPFGGYKQSGQGRDKCLESLLEYTQTKSAWMHLG